MMIINAGSENKGGTFEEALKSARVWLSSVQREFPEVTMTTHENRLGDGDWNFVFTHQVTGVSVDLDIHGFTDEECEKFTFHPRVYWNGSSTSDPKIDDWLTDDYKYRIVFSKIKS